MGVPLVLDWICDDPNSHAFFLSMILCGVLGIMMLLSNRPNEPLELNVRQAFLLTTLSWVLICLGASLPFVLSRSTETFTDSLFEAVSALTTTGSTILWGLEYASPGVLIWRALLQWLGGIGIIMMALTVLPMLQIGGMQLFRSEFSDRSEKILPKVSQVAAAIFKIYSLFTGICFLCLWGAGMSFFEAVCHAFAILSTGGFSTADSSIGYFNSAFIEGITIVFMWIGGGTLLLFVHLLKGNWRPLWKDGQIRAYTATVVVSTLVVALWHWLKTGGMPFLQALRASAFTVVSIMTTSGFSSTNYAQWESFPLFVIFLLMFVGGCTGSTAGGIKLFRFQIIFSLARSQIHKLRHPHGVFVPLYHHQKIREGIFDSVFAYLAFYGFSVILVALGLSLYNLDFITCLSGALTAVSNVGPGLGALIGPSETFVSLPDGAKWLLMLGMLLGRLEFMTIFILLTSVFWKR